MIPANKVIVALDTSDENKLNALFTALHGQDIWIKVGMELYYALGPQIVYKAKEQGFHVFLDLKLHDIPNTVAQGIRSLSQLPIDMVNVHAAGGLEMMTRSLEALKHLPKRPLLIAVTQLTSTTQEQMNREQKIAGTIEASVLQYAQLAHDAGLDGVVSSPLEVKSIKNTFGKKFITVTPGIRPGGSDLNDQKRVTTPKEAIELGTDFMVIGRPITASSDPREALIKILEGK